MNTVEHLLVVLGEEAAEIVQDCSKSLRFGLDDRNVLNPTGPTNRERLVVEINQLIAVVVMMEERGIIPADWCSGKLQNEKSAKVTKFMDYARSKGTLEDQSK